MLYGLITVANIRKKSHSDKCMAIKCPYDGVG